MDRLNGHQPDATERTLIARLQALSVDLQSDLSRLAGAPAIRQAALAQGFGQLGAPQVIQAR